MSQPQTTTAGRRVVPALTIAAALAAAVALPRGAVAAPIQAIPGVTPGVNNLTAITSAAIPGGGMTVNNVSGAGSAYSPFVPTNRYTVNYGGTANTLQSYTAGGSTYAASGLASNVIRRFVGPNNDTLWYAGTATGTGTGSTINLGAPNLNGFNAAFKQNAVNVGADNLFSTTPRADGGNPVGNNTNVDRVDLLFTAGIAARPGSQFVISDRGDTNDHDAFAVAAITSLDAAGNPASYGPLFNFDHATWGTTNLTGEFNSIILRKNNNIPNDTLHPSDQTLQGVGAVAISTSALAGNTGASTLFGYSLFSPNLNVTGDGSGTQLVDFTDANVYLPSDGTVTGGGIDPTATLAVVYTNASVPEPTAIALLTAGAVGLLARRRRRAV